MPEERYEGASRFFNSKAWIKCRASYIIKVNALCENCLKHNRIKTGDILHHKVHLNASNVRNPEIALNHDNLIFLCQSCHNSIHGKAESATAEGLYFNENGELIRT